MAVASPLKFGDYAFAIKPSPSSSQNVALVYLICAIRLPGVERPELFKFFIDTGGEFSSVEVDIINKYGCPIVGKTPSSTNGGKRITPSRNLYAGLEIIIPVASKGAKMTVGSLTTPLGNVVANYSQVLPGSPGFWASRYPNTNILGSDILLGHRLQIQLDYGGQRMLLTR